MSVFSTLVDCPNLQVYLDEAFGRPGNITDRSTFLEYLLSEAGRQGLSFRPASERRYSKKVERSVMLPGSLNQALIQQNFNGRFRCYTEKQQYDSYSTIRSATRKKHLDQN